MGSARRQPQPRVTRITLNLVLTGLCLMLAASLRMWIIRVHPPWESVFSDMGGYIQNADRIFQGRMNSQVFFQPVGFSALLALLRKLHLGYKAVGPIHVCVGTLTAFFAGRIAAHVESERAALFTTLVVGVHWSLAYMSGYYMAETLYAFMITFVSWVIASTRLKSVWSVIVASTVLSVSYWLKGYAGPIVILALGYFALRAREERGARWRWVRAGVILTCIFATQPALHHEVTKRYANDPQWGPATSGLNLVEGKCPWKRNEDSSGYGWWSPLYVQQHNGTYKKWDHPFTDAKYFQQQGIKCIKDNPMVMVHSFRHVAELFVRNMLWPASGDEHFRKFERDYEKWFLGFLFPGLIVGLFRLGTSSRARQHLFGLAVMVPILAICGVVYIGKSEIRYRLPFDPFFCLIACSGWLGIADFLHRVFRALRRVRAPRPPVLP